MVSKVKRRWWTWTLGILLNVLAVGSLLAQQRAQIYRQYGPSYLLFFIVFLIDIFIILPDATHLCYIIESKTFTVKRTLFSYIVIPYGDITALDNAPLLTFGGFGVKIWDDSFETYKITYRKKGRLKVVIISPKDPMFIRELCAYVDDSVILFNNKETPFNNTKIENDSNKK